MWYLQNLERAPLKNFQVPTDAEPASISNIQGVASYSWVQRRGNVSLAIPGSPPVWNNPRTPLRVPQDSGTVFIDQNGARCDVLKTSSLTPLFKAVDSVAPQFSFEDVDLVTDRNNLRKLLRWLNGEVDKAFRIDIQLGGDNCIIFTRTEEKTTESIPHGQFRGYGHTFEHAATTTAVRDATGHHRIITYNLSGLKIMLRFEVDACISEGTNVDDLAQAFNSLGINSSSPSTSAGSSLIPSTITTNQVVNQSRLVELKTMTQNKSIKWAEVYPQLYLSGTPHLYVAKHNRGSFVQIEEHNLNDNALSSHTRSTKRSLGRLCILLDAILVVLKEDEHKGENFALVCTAGGALSLYKKGISTYRDLSDDILERFRKSK